MRSTHNGNGMETLDVLAIGCILGYVIRPYWEYAWKRINEKLNEWADVS